MTQDCLHCSSSFDITQQDLDFYIKISPTFTGQKFQIPTPKLCSDCRQQQRMSFRNERNLYRRTCDASGKQIVSMYKPDCGYKVYDQKIRFSDQRNAKDYAMEYDFGKSFTENFRALSLQVPRPSMYNFFAENSDYCNCTSYQKDCYLTSASTYNEKCMYAAYTNDCNYCFDTFMTFESEQLYMTIDCEKCFKLLYGSNCRNCSESHFLTNCSNCRFCWNCDGLENKSYCIDNIQYEKEVYLEKLKTLLDTGFEQTRGERLQKKQIDTILFSENSTGNHLRYCKNSEQCFDGGNLENCKNCTWFFDAKECQDNYSRGQHAELCYQNTAIGENIYHILFSTNINTNAHHIYYSMHCRSSRNCFGCVGLVDAEYCIFNKQYSKEDYEKTVANIITHMIATGERGEFFHPSLSPFGYNETVAMEYYPTLHRKRSPSLIREEKIGNLCPPDKGDTAKPRGFEKLESFGYHRSTYEAPKPVSDKVIQGKDLPDTIDEVDESILQYAIACEVTGKLFRIQSAELAFYRKHHLPLPRKHPDQRHLERLAIRR